MPELGSYFGGQVFTEQELADIRLRSFAGRITNDAVLWKVVRDAKPELREQVYDEIKPHLKFEPLEYSKLAASCPACTDSNDGPDEDLYLDAFGCRAFVSDPE